MHEDIQVQVMLRERNQLTIPDRVAARIEAKPGDRLLLTIETGEPGVVRLIRRYRRRGLWADH